MTNAGTVDDMLCAIATLRGEIVILHSANARGASMVNEINVARAAFARRLGDALGISEDDSIIAAIEKLRADLARVTGERDEARANACRCADDESCRRVREGREAVARAERAEKERDAELASLRNEVSRLSALSTAHSQIADAWKARAARDAETTAQISRLVGPPRCEACVREGRYVPCLECPEPGAPSGWVSGGGTSEVK